MCVGALERVRSTASPSALPEVAHGRSAERVSQAEPWHWLCSDSQPRREVLTANASVMCRGRGQRTRPNTLPTRNEDKDAECNGVRALRRAEGDGVGNSRKEQAEWSMGRGWEHRSATLWGGSIGRPHQREKPLEWERCNE